MTGRQGARPDQTSVKAMRGTRGKEYHFQGSVFSKIAQLQDRRAATPRERLGEASNTAARSLHPGASYEREHGGNQCSKRACLGTTRIAVVFSALPGEVVRQKRTADTLDFPTGQKWSGPCI